SFSWLGFGTAHGSMDAGSQWRSICAGLARVIYSFFAGVLVFRLWKASGIDFSLPPIISVAALGAVLLSYPSATYQVLFDLFATLFVFPALVFLGACSIPADCVKTRSCEAARQVAQFGGSGKAPSASSSSTTASISSSVNSNFGPNFAISLASTIASQAFS